MTSPRRSLLFCILAVTAAADNRTTLLTTSSSTSDLLTKTTSTNITTRITASNSSTTPTTTSTSQTTPTTTRPLLSCQKCTSKKCGIGGSDDLDITDTCYTQKLCNCEKKHRAGTCKENCKKEKGEPSICKMAKFMGCSSGAENCQKCTIMKCGVGGPGAPERSDPCYPQKLCNCEKKHRAGTCKEICKNEKDIVCKPCSVDGGGSLSCQKCMSTNCVGELGLGELTNFNDAKDLNKATCSVMQKTCKCDTKHKTSTCWKVCKGGEESLSCKTARTMGCRRSGGGGDGDYDYYDYYYEDSGDGSASLMPAAASLILPLAAWVAMR